MAKEQDEQPEVLYALVTGIHVDLVARTLTLTGDHDIVARLALAPEGVIFGTTPRKEALPMPDTHSSPGESPSVEKEKPQTLQGRLKSKPIPGRADRNNQPTAWARFAAHDPDQEGAHLYSATFHRHTANLALSMDKDTSLTVQGFPHEQTDTAPRRLDTLSVINILDYPGKSREQ